MTINAESVMILLAVLAPMLLYIVRTEHRLTRIETKIDILMECTPACQQPSEKDI